MSCCDGCNQGLGCCDGLGEPYAISDYVVAGSVIAWGGHILLPGSNTASGWGDDVEASIKNALWNHGGFSWVDAGRESGLINPYISIKVTTRVDFQHLVDILRTIEGAIYQAGFRPETQAFWIESIPSTAEGNMNIAQAGTGGSINANQSSQSSSTGCPPGYYDASVFGGYLGVTCKKLPDVADSSDCDWKSMSIGDYIACELGITPSMGVAVGIGAAVLGVIVLKRIL